MIDVDILESLLDYNPDTGHFFWTNFNNANARKGKKAGSSRSNKYIRIFIYGKPYQAHRIAWVMYYGKEPEYGIDHIDGNPLNNAIDNLRDVPQSVNSRNSAKNKCNKSGFSGVTWMKGIKRWRARIMFNRRDIHLGFFIEKKDAISARVRANKKYGFHKNHGRQ